MKELLLATTNVDKIAEIKTILSQTPYKIVTPDEVGIDPKFEVEETGKTLAKNSELKAMAFASVSQMLSLADDSGLFVVMLQGRPGVKSKRFAPGTDLNRCLVLLGQMHHQENRQAAFIADLCLYDPKNKKAVHFEGRVEGKLTHQVQGEGGFGYDPIFIPDGYDQTFAELGEEVKNQISHRAIALAKLKEYLQLKQD